jgi:hypothetical protein
MSDILQDLRDAAAHAGWLPEDKALLERAADEIASLRKQFLDSVTTILSQVKENAKIIEESHVRLDRAGL